MIVTEEEAKTKRCQESFGPLYVTERGGETYVPSFTAVTVAYGASIVSSGSQLPTVASPSHCIGSACMAWRWAGGQFHEGKMVVPGSTTHGYCGKAGNL